MAKETINVLVKRPSVYPYIQKVKNELKDLQELVGGYIQSIRFTDDSVLLCDEEGKIKHKQANFMIWSDIIVGTAVIVGVDGEDFTDCPITPEKFKEILEATP